MLAALREKGYALTFDADNPQRDSRWTTLLYYAEQVKHKLTDSKKADVRKNGIFQDDSKPAKMVQLSFSMTEAEFREIIESDINRTIQATRNVLEKAGQTAADVDYLVLVGGSSRIPAIRERLQQEFGLEPQFDEDVLDLSVAAGAAMMAATSGSSSQGVFLNHIPTEADDTTIGISGRVEASVEHPDPSHFIITVLGGSSEEISASTESDGGFYLEVELFEDDENELTISIVSPTGEQIFTRQCLVRHNEDSSPPPPPPPPIPPLPKPISVDTVSGLDEIAPENVPLPYENTQSFETVAELNEIPIDVYQEDMQLSTLLIKDFGKPVPAHCQVDLTVKIDTDYSMTVTASVPSANISKTQEVQLTKPVIPNSEELKSDYANLKVKYLSALENSPDGPKKARIAAEADRALEEIAELVEDEHIERMQMYLLLKRLALLTKELLSAGQLSPPKKEMDRKFAEIRRLLPQAEGKDPALRDQDLSTTISALESRAAEAAANLDVGTWQQVARKLGDIIRMLESIIKGEGTGDVELPPPPILKMQLEQWAHQLAQEYEAKKSTLPSAIASQIPELLSQARKKLETIDVTSPDAQNQLINVIVSNLKPVNEWLNPEGGSHPGGGGVIQRRG